MIATERPLLESMHEGFDRANCPLSEMFNWIGEVIEDYTNIALYENSEIERKDGITNLDTVLAICNGLRTSAMSLTRRRHNKADFTIEDEYDIQDLLLANLVGLFPQAIPENPISKHAGTVATKADITIEDLGILIELKYAKGAQDKKLLAELANDLEFYRAWDRLHYLIFVIYNSHELRNPKAFQTLSGKREINEQSFMVHVILV